MPGKNIKPEPEEIFNWLNTEFLKKYGCDNFSDDKFILIIGETIQIVLPESGSRLFFSRPFSHQEGTFRSDPHLKILCFSAGENFIRSAMRILPGINDKNRRDIPFINKRGIAISVGRESNSLSLLNINEKRALFIFEDLKSIPYYEAGSPFKTILQWWFDSNSSAMLHSASVIYDGRAVLIGGRGGAGKTSTALSCISHGMDYLGDDYVIVSDKNGFIVSSVYNSAKLTRGFFNKFPKAGKNIINPDFSGNEKGVIFINDSGKTAASGSFPLKAVIFPEISGLVQSSFVTISPSEGFRTLGPSTVFQHIGRRKNISAFASRLTKNIPCYKLVAGTDPKLVSESVKKIVEVS